MSHRTCSIAGCEKPHRARGLCQMHYKRAGHSPRTKYPRTCEVCEIDFLSHRQSGRFCSDACKGVDYAAVKRTKSPLPADHPVLVLIAANDELARALNARPWFYSVYFYDCVICGELFTTRHFGLSTCDDVCADEKRLAMASRHRHKRRERVSAARGGDDVIHWRRLVREDGPACHLCGYDVDPDDFEVVPGRDGRDAVKVGLEFPTVDHVVALAAGGSHERSNARLAHAYCNAVKSDLPLEAVA